MFQVVWTWLQPHFAQCNPVSEIFCIIWWKFRFKSPLNLLTGHIPLLGVRPADQNSPADLPRPRGTAAAAWEAVERKCVWWCPGSRSLRIWRTCTPINPPLRHLQGEEEPRPDPPPPAHDGSAPSPGEETGNQSLTDKTLWSIFKRFYVQNWSSLNIFPFSV